MERKAVRVKWLDPYSIDEWTTIPTEPEPVLWIESFGYEIHRDDTVTVIALNYDPENEKMSCATVIPNACIKSYEVINGNRD